MQVEWSGVSFPTPGDFPDPEIKPASVTSLALASRFFTTSATWEATMLCLVSPSDQGSPALRDGLNEAWNKNSESAGVV